MPGNLHTSERRVRAWSCPVSRRCFRQFQASLDGPTGLMPQVASSGQSSFTSLFADEPDDAPGLVLLTVPEAAAVLRVSEKTVRRRISDGTIRAARIGRLLRIFADGLARLGADGAE